MSDAQVFFGRVARALSRRSKTTRQGVKGLLRGAKELGRQLPFLPSFLYHVRWRLAVRNTKHDITYCVFKESYLGDQYGIREFADSLRGQERLVLFDLGRNHGLILLFLADYLARTRSTIRTIDYVGVDPSPLKFVYPKTGAVEINYRLIDKAIVYDDRASVALKYGDDNFGNFNVSGSNYEERRRRKKEFIEIVVDAIPAEAVVEMIKSNPAEVPLIVKIDFKYRSERFFEIVAGELAGRPGPYLIACEKDGTAEGEIGQYQRPEYGSLVLMKT